MAPGLYRRDQVAVLCTPCMLPMLGLLPMLSMLGMLSRACRACWLCQSSQASCSLRLCMSCSKPLRGDRSPRPVFGTMKGHMPLALGGYAT